MAVRVHVPGYLRQYTGGAALVDLPGAPATVGKALEALWAIHPGVRDRMVTEHGEVRPHVNVFVAAESIRWLGGLDAPLRDGEEISIVPAVSGG